MPKKIVSEKVFAFVLVGGILSILLAGCSGQKGERAYEPKARQPTTSEDSAYEFVGGVFDARELVAIVADKTVSEGTNKTVSEGTNKTVSEGTSKTVSGAGRRKVQAYVCDGEPQGDAEWFTGRTTDNTLDLTSASGRARLQVGLSETEATGTVTLADGIPRRFTLAAAREGAGLYEVTIAPDGRRSGTSANGAKDEGRVRSNGAFTTGTIRLPGGEAVDYRTQRTAGYEGVANRSDTYTTIVLPGVEKERGRGGDVKAGSPSSNVISNDLVL